MAYSLTEDDDQIQNSSGSKFWFIYIIFLSFSEKPNGALCWKKHLKYAIVIDI
jgi:hypothetical protein